MRIQSFPVESMRLQTELRISATPEQVFASLTTGIAFWWSPKHLESSKLALDLVLEPKIGGRLYESWRTSADKEGALLGHVIQIRKNRILKISGYFGLEEQCASGVASFILHRHKHEPSTTVEFTYDVVGEINDEIRKKMTAFWQELLDDLKLHVEKHAPRGVRSEPSLEA